MALTADDVVERCRAALVESTPVLAVRDVLDQLVAEPAALELALGPVDAGGITAVHRGDDLTILRVAWTPGMAINPHEHRMWAAIGMYGGQEDNAFYRRVPGGLEPAGGREVTPGEVLVLGDDVVHSVANSRREFAVALHVYGGDFFSAERSEWTFGTFEERPRDIEATMRLFEQANARWRGEA
jgi:predicted metal-dependent enzyme (double-stranded beta helix superfamily)